MRLDILKLAGEISLREFLAIRKAKDRGFTMDKFAKECEISVNYLHKILAGKYIPSIKVAKKITKATGGIVSSNKILGLD